jgi:ABC-type glycerol-3-phosphate transport system substrate-binding protein
MAGRVLTTSTPGSAYRNWVDNVITRFQSKYPGTKVEVTLLPANNDQLAAKVESAFASHSVPDVMMLYSGAYTARSGRSGWAVRWGSSFVTPS